MAITVGLVTEEVAQLELNCPLCHGVPTPDHAM